MENSFFDNPLVVTLGAILLLPVALKMLEQVIPLIRDRVAAVLPGITDWMRHTFRWAGQRVTDEGELSVSQAVYQTAGSILLIASAVVYTVAELQFTWATLCPMFGGECTGEVFAGYDRLLSLSTILLVVSFGLTATDLVCWTYTTQFARIERARGVMLFIALLCLLTAIMVSVTMAWYRDLILGMGQTDMAAVETTATLQDLQTFILLSLAALLFIGTLFAFTSFDTFFSAVLAGLAVISGLVLALGYLLMALMDLLAAVILVMVKTVQEALTPLTNALQEGMRGIRAGGSTAWAKLRSLVAPRGTAKPVTRDKKEPLASPSPGQSVEGEMSRTEKQAREKTANGYDAQA
jgi:hypothetical protein